MGVLRSEADIGSQTEVASETDRAWGPLLGACLCSFCGMAAVVYFTYGLFQPHIVRDTGWSAAGVAAAMGPGVLFGGLMLPLVGRMTDKFGGRRLILMGGISFAIGMVCLGLLSVNLIMFTVLTMVTYLLGFAGTVLPYARVLTGWFVKRRGMALSLMFCAAALGTAAWPLFAAFLIEDIGWRRAYVVMGCIAGGVIFLCGLFLLRDAPEPQPIEFGTAVKPGLTVSEALRSALFWKICLIFTVVSAVFGGSSVQFPILLQKLGVDGGTAAASMSMVGIAMFVSRVLLGLVIDRLFVAHATIGIILVGALAFALLLVGIAQPLVFAAAFFVGFGLGAEYAIVAYIVSQAFGLRAYGAIYGIITLATTLGMAGGPAAIGVSLVTGVAPVLIFGGIGVALALAIAVLLTLKRTDFAFGQPTKP
ncbi:MFS transporter [Rhizorhabdus sp.]|uniref:MFS transporter n=1 Tax=Rhizorhabdus sp. TaxID=1968843 RepID=UPI0019C8518C|nr:MFS transporter [Rhizorhabdus sp.]MBD3759337.1 MFS transporter [Rhizorhabdus sp.]